MPTNKPRFTFQISPEIAAKIEAAALRERRTTANFLAFHIEQLFSPSAVRETSEPAPALPPPVASPYKIKKAKP